MKYEEQLSGRIKIVNQKNKSFKEKSKPKDKKKDWSKERNQKREGY